MCIEDIAALFGLLLQLVLFGRYDMKTSQFVHFKIKNARVCWYFQSFQLLFEVLQRLLHRYSPIKEVFEVISEDVAAFGRGGAHGDVRRYQHCVHLEHGSLLAQHPLELLQVFQSEPGIGGSLNCGATPSCYINCWDKAGLWLSDHEVQIRSWCLW